MKPYISLLWLPVLAIAILVVTYQPSKVFASGIYIDPCGNTDSFSGASSTVFVCTVGNTTVTSGLSP